MDREAWCAAIHGVTKSWTWLSDWTELNWTQVYVCLYIYYFSDSFSLLVITKYWVYFTVLNVTSLLVIYVMYNSMYIREGSGTLLQYSCLENPMAGGAWKAAVHGIAEGQTRLSDLTFTFHLHALEKEMATHSSVLASRIPGMGVPGGLPSMGSHRVGHGWSNLAAAACLC